MLFTVYLDSIENTEKEQQFLETVLAAKIGFEMAGKLPFVGKLMRALVALGEAQSIEEFKQSEHYESIVGYNISGVNLEKGYFNVTPGRDTMINVAKVAAIVFAVILLLRLCRRRDCDCD